MPKTSSFQRLMNLTTATESEDTSDMEKKVCEHDIENIDTENVFIRDSGFQEDLVEKEGKDRACVLLIENWWIKARVAYNEDVCCRVIQDWWRNILRHRSISRLNEHISCTQIQRWWREKQGDKSKLKRDMENVVSSTPNKNKDFQHCSMLGKHHHSFTPENKLLSKPNSLSHFMRKTNYIESRTFSSKKSQIPQLVFPVYFENFMRHKR